MPTIVRCLGCQTQLSVADENLGRWLRCPACKTTFQTQQPGQVEPRRRQEEIEEDPPRNRRGEEEEDEERPRGRRFEYDEDEEEEEERPRRRRRRDAYEDEEDEEDRVHWRNKASGQTAMAIISYVFCFLPLIGFILVHGDEVVPPEVSGVFCLFPVVGFILGLIAYNGAHSLLREMRRRGAPPSVRQRAQQTKHMALVGIILSVVFFFLACGALRFVAMSRR